MQQPEISIHPLIGRLRFTFIFPHDHEAFFVQIVRLYVKSVGFLPRIYIIISAFPIRSSKGANKV